MSTEKKTVESHVSIPFTKNKIQINNGSDELLVALIKMDPNARYYQEIEFGASANVSGGSVNGGMKQALKETGPIQKVILRPDNSHEVQIDGNKTYISVFILDSCGKHYLGVHEDRLVKKNGDFNVKKEHIEILTSPKYSPTKFDLIFNKILPDPQNSTQTSNSSTNSTAIP